MNKDQIKGAADQATGTVKKVVGETIGNKKLETEGVVEKVTGKVESTVGDAKQTIGDVIKKAKS